MACSGEEDSVLEQFAGISIARSHSATGPRRSIGADSKGAGSKRKRQETSAAEVDHLVNWASAANLRAGWDLYSKLRAYGIQPEAESLTLRAEPVSESARSAMQSRALARESILHTLKQRRARRAELGLYKQGIADESRSDSTHSRPQNWARLPVDVALQIVELLDEPSHLKTSCTCDTFRGLVSYMVSSLSFAWCHSAGLEVNEVVRGAAVLLNRLETISTRRHSLLMDGSIVRLISANHDTLKVVDLSGCHKLTDTTLLRLALSCRNLCVLDVSSCKRMTNSVFIHLAKGCPQLFSLNACGCEKLTDTGVLALSIHCNRLQEINLGWCHQLTDFGISRLASGCPDLRVVDLCGCHNVRDASIQALAASCLSLSSLGLHCLRGLTDLAMLSLSYHLEGLTSLNVSGCTLLTEEAVQGVIHSNPGLHTCSSRRSVIFSGCMGLVGIQCGCHRVARWTIA